MWAFIHRRMARSRWLAEKPICGKGYTAELLGDKAASAIALSYGKTSAQVILRWNLHKGVAVLLGSSDSNHFKEEIVVFEFVLTDE